MDKVKQTIHYWCDDIRNGRCTGDKIGIAVLDTGLSPHPDLSGRVKAFRDCVYGKETLYDESGHGTHVAGILCGSGRMSGGAFAGMAPKAELVVVKMLDQKGEGSMEQMSAAVDWVKSNWRKYGIRIVNISVGARAGIQKGKEEEIVKKVEELWDEGLFVIAAAGRREAFIVPGKDLQKHVLLSRMCWLRAAGSFPATEHGKRPESSIRSKAGRLWRRRSSPEQWRFFYLNTRI